MCLAYTLRVPFPELRKRLGLPVPSVLETWNRIPGHAVMTVRKDIRWPVGGDLRPGLVVDTVVWGYRGNWTSGPGARITRPLPLAKAENAVMVTSLSNMSLRERRCIVIADGWYAWPLLGNRRRDLKHPHFVHFRDDRVFGFGGIWTDELDKHNPTVAILTVPANGLLRNLPAERMPVIVQQQDWDTWLSVATPGKRIMDFLKPWPARALEMWPVASLVNDPKNNSPKCIEPVGAKIRYAAAG